MGKIDAVERQITDCQIQLADADEKKELDKVRRLDGELQSLRKKEEDLRKKEEDLRRKELLLLELGSSSVLRCAFHDTNNSVLVCAGVCNCGFVQGKALARDHGLWIRRMTKVSTPASPVVCDVSMCGAS